jgi:hypothetical protein
MGILLNKSKNYIINGAMDFWQRNTTFAAVASGVYTADRMQYIKTGTMVHTVSRSTDVPTLAQSGFPFQHSFRYQLTTFQNTLAASNSVGLLMRIEGSVIAPLQRKNCVFSFWVKATLAGTYPVAFRSIDNTRSFVTTYTINQSNTWERKSVSFFFDTSSGSWPIDTGTGMLINMPLATSTTAQAPALNTWLNGLFTSHSSCVNGVQSGATDFFITGIQLEEGTESSNFELAGGNPINELMLCQRYYEKSYNINTPPGSLVANGSNYYVAASAAFEQSYVNFKTRKRASPVVRYYNPSTGDIDQHRDATVGAGPTVTSSLVSETTATFTWLVAPIAGRLYLYHWVADAEL